VGWVLHSLEVCVERRDCFRRRRPMAVQRPASGDSGQELFSTASRGRLKNAWHRLFLCALYHLQYFR
jgi:hypothetical protein